MPPSRSVSQIIVQFLSVPLLLPSCQVKLREPSTKDHMLDFLHRWQLGGGDAIIVDLPAPICCTCGPGEGGQHWGSSSCC